MKNQTLYLECYSGISGDMTVAALLDLGADEKVLLEGLKSLNVEGYQINIGRRAKNSIDACDFDVVLAYPENHDHNYEHPQHHSLEQHKHSLGHNHEHSLGHNHEHSLGHNNEHSQEQNHEHSQIHSHNYRHSHDHNDKISHHDKHRHQDHSQHHEKPHHRIHHSSPALAKSSVSPLVLGHHEHRNLMDINEIIENSSISARAKQLAKKIFLIIAEAEAKAHAKPLDEVHFHEVGAIDSIVDIVAAAICIDNLNITDVIVSELYEGMGQIMCQHGLLPIPVPAVVNISSAHQLRLHITNVQGELVTPTGAAIVAAIRTRESLPKDFQIYKIGLGAGKRNYPGASGILRAMLIEESDASIRVSAKKIDVEESTNISKEYHQLSASSISDRNNNSSKIPLHTSDSMTHSNSDTVWVLEANIDDCTGEALAFTMELLFKNGAKDVYYTPIYMKKSRPAYMIGIICIEEHIPAMERLLFTHTTTIGLRRHKAIRTILPREIRTIATPEGEARVKICTYDANTFYYPEYEDVKRLALSSGQDFFSAYEMIKNLAKSSV